MTTTRVVLIDLVAEFDSDTFARQHAPDLFRKDQQVAIWRADERNSRLSSGAEALWRGWPRPIGETGGSLYNEIVDELAVHSEDADGAASVTELVFAFVYNRPSDIAANPVITPEQMREVAAASVDFRAYGDNRHGSALRVFLVALFLSGTQNAQEVAAAVAASSDTKETGPKLFDKAIFVADVPSDSPRRGARIIAGIRVAIDLMRDSGHFDAEGNKRFGEGLRLLENPKPVFALKAPVDRETRPARYGARCRQRIIAGLQDAPDDEDGDLTRTVERMVRACDTYRETSTITELELSWTDPLKSASANPDGRNLSARTKKSTRRALDDLYARLSDYLPDMDTPESEAGRMFSTVDEQIAALCAEIRTAGCKSHTQMRRLREGLVDKRRALAEGAEASRVNLVGRASAIDPLEATPLGTEWMRSVAQSLTEKRKLDEALVIAQEAAARVPVAFAYWFVVVTVLSAFYIPRFLQVLHQSEKGLGAQLLEAATYGFKWPYLLNLTLFSLIFVLFAFFAREWAIRRYNAAIVDVKDRVGSLSMRLKEIIENATARSRTAASIHWLEQGERALAARLDAEARDLLYDAALALPDGRAPGEDIVPATGASPNDRLAILLMEGPATAMRAVTMTVDPGADTTAPFECPSVYYAEPGAEIGLRYLEDTA